MTVTLRPAGWRDAWRLYRWRNDPSTGAWMFGPAPTPLNHLVWLSWILSARSASRLYIGLDEKTGEVVGTGRLDNNPWNIPEVSVTVDHRRRNRGYGTAIVEALVAEARMSGAKAVRAYIMPSNEASIRTFFSAGFAYLDPVGSKIVMERRCD